MGEVYRARDSRLGRDVAIKIVPEAFATDSERMVRFEREARVLASLNHTNIAAIYGLEPSGATRALVMEIVEGPTLADRIEEGPIPLEDALPIARQIAEALEYAHDRGVVHRDLKPANVKLRPDGTVKVLDFGLAKALEEDGDAAASSPLSHSPTLTQRMTAAGMILGTAAYMAPEQAKGKNADRRADVWSFGVVLFEMLTGERLFDGETVSETLASVMKDEVRWDRLPAGLPPRTRRLLERCLTRDPRQRLQSIGEARIILEGGTGAGGVEEAHAAAPAQPVPPTPRALSTLAWIAISIALAALAVVVSRALTRPSVAPGALRKYALVLHPEATRATTQATLSPDGSHIAFYAGDALWVRSLVTLETRELCKAISSLMRPAWSPDGTEVMFTDGSRLLKMPIAGGQQTPICPMPGSPTGGTGASWAADGRVFLTLGFRGLFEVPATGGDAREILPTDSTSSDFHDALALPGGRGVIFIRHRREGGPDALAVFDGKTWKDLLVIPDAGLSRPSWSPSGHILFARASGNPGIWALPFSLARLEATRDPFLVAADANNPSISESGTLLYSRGNVGNAMRAVWVDRSGAVLDTLSEELNDPNNLALSPDGRRAALVVSDGGNRDLWVLDLERRAKARLTFASGNQSDPAWSADGKEIFYRDDPQMGVYAIAASGGGMPRRVSRGRGPAATPTGSIAFVVVDPTTGDDVFLQSAPADTTGSPFATEMGSQAFTDFDPSGRFLAYNSSESGRFEVFIARVAGGGAERWQVSNQGGRRPRWNSAGDRLYYQSHDGSQLWEVEIALGDVPTIGAPRLVFDLSKAGVKHWGGRNYAPHPDGKRFLTLLVPTGWTDAGNVIVAENWHEEFRAK
jgi:serine/threonine-protein kinase